MVLLVIPGSALAALVVDFSAAPLFAEANILPGDAVERTIVVSNTGLESESVEFAFENIIDGPMSSVTQLAVWDDDRVYVDDTFAALFTGGPYSLGELAPGTSRTYTFMAGLPVEVGNVVQAEQFGFAIRIGFAGAQQVTDTARSFGAGGGSRTLQLFNETVTIESGFGGAFVTWNSNTAASSYMVCGNLVNGPFPLTTEYPLFGYEFAIGELAESNTTHGMAVSTTPGSYECRPAGRTGASDGFTVGDPVRFTLAGSMGEVAGVQTSLSEADIQELLTSIIEQRSAGSVFGMSSKGAGNVTYDQFRAELDERDARQAAEPTTGATDSTVDEPGSRVDTAAATQTTAGNQDDSNSNNRLVLWVLVVCALGLGAYYYGMQQKV